MLPGSKSKNQNYGYSNPIYYKPLKTKTMKKITMIAVLCLFSLVSVYSQQNDQILIKKRNYMLNDKKLTNDELKTLLRSDPESGAMLKKAGINYTVGYILLTTGSLCALTGAVISFAESAKQASDVSNGKISSSSGSAGLAPILVGAGLVIAAVPFVVTGNKQLKKSINLYNAKRTSGYNTKVKLDFNLSTSGVGIACRF